MTEERLKLDGLVGDRLEIDIELAELRERITSVRMQLSERESERGTPWWHSARAALRNMVEEKAGLERELAGLKEIENARRLELNAVKQQANGRQSRSKADRRMAHIQRLEAYQGALHRAIRERYGQDVLIELKTAAQPARDALSAKG